MMVFGGAGVGKTSVGWDALLAQAAADVHCVLALSSGGVARARHALAQLRRRGDSLVDRVTIVCVGDGGPGTVDAAAAPAAALAAATPTQPSPGPSAEPLLVLAAAAAIGESVRDAGGHALVRPDLT